MQVTLDIPEDLIQTLGLDAKGLSRVALEAFVLEGVRSSRLTTAQAQRLLGIRSRYEMDGFLKAHGVMLPLTLDDVRRDSETALSFQK